jgi:hypothetical protein
MGSPSLEHSNRRFYEIGTSTVAKYAFLRLVGIGRGHCLFVKYVLLTVSILRGSPIIFFPEPLTRKFLKWARIFFGGSTSIGSWWFYTFCSTKTWRTQNFGRIYMLVVVKRRSISQWVIERFVGQQPLDSRSARECSAKGTSGSWKRT